jgi:hypothetical protein
MPRAETMIKSLSIRTTANGPMNEKLNPHQGSAFDDFLKSEGIYEEAMASPKVKKAFKDLSDSIEAGQHEAFAAGWNAFLATHSVLLIAHGIKEVHVGFERAWNKYWEKQKESNSALPTDRPAKKLSTLPQNRRLRGGPVLRYPAKSLKFKI